MDFKILRSGEHMISSVSSINNNKRINFGTEYSKDTLLPNTIGSEIELNANNITSAFTEYPLKGITGSKNSNFHEFLTMGIVPYTIGCATMIGVAAAANKNLNNGDLHHAKKFTKFVALGVIFYGLFKKISDTIINKATKWGTGFDSQAPYVKINYQLKEKPTDKDSKNLEYHRIGESVDYPYWSLMYGEGDKLNERFDKLGKRNGFGDKLNDSDQELKPAIKEVLVKSTLAKNIVSYIWAATGVALATQASWENFSFKQLIPPFKKIINNFKNYEFKDSLSKSWKDLTTPLKDIGICFKDAFKGLWHDKFGKVLIMLSLAGSVLGSANAVNIKNKPQEKSVEIFDPNKESVEC